LTEIQFLGIHFDRATDKGRRDQMTARMWQLAGEDRREDEIGCAMKRLLFRAALQIFLFLARFHLQRILLVDSIVFRHRLRQTFVTTSLAVGWALVSTLAIAQTKAPAAKTVTKSGTALSAAKAPAAWPTGPVRLLVGFPPGSVQDLSARAIAEPLAKALGQPVIVDNKAGASGTIAAAQVARATDEHTLGVMNNSQLTIAKLLNPAVAYDPAKDLAPIAFIGTAPLLLVVNQSATGTTPQEWLLWLRNQGAKGNYGSPGSGTPGHLGIELLKSRVGFEAKHIPYPGNPQVVNALLSGELQAALLPPNIALPHVQAGKLKAVGVTSGNRSALAPDVPTLRDAGVQGGNFELWTALAGPASMPAPVREKLGTAVIAVLKSDEVRNRLLNVGWQPTPSTAEGLASRMRQDSATFGGIIMMRGIKADN
jgi:tripartite-type tricarboxylate transporter receptor subunit TctC